MVDESALTGEATPVQKRVGSAVMSGTVVQNGYIEVEASTPHADSAYARLQQEVADVQADKGGHARLVRCPRNTRANCLVGRGKAM